MIMTDIPAVALFRLSVLGPLASRERLERGELKRLIGELAARSYAIPGAKRTRLSEKTIESWYYAWRRGGIEALAPKPRCDRGSPSSRRSFRRPAFRPSGRIPDAP
jgi:hypothetical protein